ncbi:MAG: type IV pilus twitching motility protein PilT [Patescibacteria group bacterium]|nr:type IV pilus twitching motility protein PilT [Patescibacteria group bacterium]MDD5715631.1 type IV pilus twitching motility protein PilT [Patescibacteria group bacterium]
MAKIDTIFQKAIDNKASDIHLTADRPPIFRIDGELIEMDGAKPLKATDVYNLVFEMLSEKQQQLLTQNRELDLSYELNGGQRFRVNCFWERDNVALAARIIASAIPTLDELYLPNVVRDLIRLKQGLILVTGPTGCGKSTTLAAMIDFINQDRGVHIITLEDPIEFVYPSGSGKCLIVQRQLGTDMITFGDALKHVLRQDPNVILVGEMRDLETIAATITLAETGHLVLATLHTFNAAQTVDRIIDVFPPYQQQQIRLQLSLFLKGIISQQLLQKIGGGRISAREILINTPAVSNLIRENKVAQIKTVIQTSAEDGMFTIDQDLKRLFENGYIEKELAKTYMANPSMLES